MAGFRGPYPDEALLHTVHGAAFDEVELVELAAQRAPQHRCHEVRGVRDTRQSALFQRRVFGRRQGGAGGEVVGNGVCGLRHQVTNRPISA